MITPAIYRVHHIERLPLRTPYPAQVARVQYLKSRLPRDATLVIDDGGSRGVGDMFVDVGLDPSVDRAWPRCALARPARYGAEGDAGVDVGGPAALRRASRA